MIWARLKRLWKLSGAAEVDWDKEGNATLTILGRTPKATFIPYEKVDPVKKITEEAP